MKISYALAAIFSATAVIAAPIARLAGTPISPSEGLKARQGTSVPGAGLVTDVSPELASLVNGLIGYR
jgi:hypothetical protein